MTQPSPAPAASGSFAGITLTVPSTSGKTSGADRYDLGTWGSQNIDPGDLPIIANLIAGNKGTTGDDLVKAFASASPQTLAEIQRTLYLGGFYGQNSTYNPTYGVIAPKDITAFAHAVITAGQANRPLSDLLLDQAKIGTAAGISAAQSQLGSTKASAPNVIDVPATADLEDTATKAFEQVLGRKANPHEAAAFAAAYQATVVGLQRNADAKEAAAAATADGTAGGLSAGQVQHYQNKLDQIGLAPTPGSSAQFSLLNHGLTQPESFQEQLGDLQSLGSSVAEAAAAKTPTVGSAGAPAEIEADEPPSVDVAAENFARSQHPKAAAGNDIASAFDTFLSILGSSFGGG